MTKDIDDQSRVRLSLAQFWGIIVAVAFATFVVAGGLYDIKSEQVAARNELALYRQTTESKTDALFRAVYEIRDDRAEKTREWGAWRYGVDRTDQRQDNDIQTIRNERHAIKAE